MNQITCCSNQVVPGGTHNFTPGKQRGAAVRVLSLCWGAIGCDGVRWGAVVWVTKKLIDNFRECVLG